MIHRALLVALAFAAGTFPSARAETYHLDDTSTVTIDTPPTWTVLEKKFRMPLMILGPTLAGSNFRLTIDLSPIDGIPQSLLDPKLFPEFEKTFTKGKTAWIKGKGGELIHFSPYKKEHWAHIPIVHRLEFSYRWDEQDFLERTFYFNCGSRSYHMKALIPITPEKDANEEKLHEVLDSVACAK